MSLFGTSPTEATATAATRSRNSLFDDEPSPALGSKSSLFADDDNAPGWGMPTPKKAGRADLVKSLLPASEVPDTYIDVFDNLVRDGYGSSGKISVEGVQKVLNIAQDSNPDDVQQIRNVIYGEKDSAELGRNEFNVLLALIGLSQEHGDITLDSVDERRRNLPVPQLPKLFAGLPGVETLAAQPPQRPGTPPPDISEGFQPPAPRTPKKNSLDFPEVDPWGSAALHVGHNHENAGSQRVNGAHNEGSNGTGAPVRTTSSFTTASVGDSNENQPSLERPTAPTGLWGSYEGNPTASYSNEAPATALGGEGFGEGGGAGGPARDPPARAFGGGRVTSSGPEETIVVTLLPEKEGVFMFQHHNYHVSSVRRNSKVVRRYSDFVWLLDCLQKRSPFRQLPLLPPKRVGVNGSHLAADNLFIEKRRRGLARFANALVRHPVLSQEQLVIMFLTVPTELAVWRKQATVSVQEEFIGRPLPPGLEDSLSPTLNELFEKTRSGIRRSAELYISLCNMLDRLAKRTEGLAADQLRISLSLQSLTDASADTYSTDTNDVPLLNEGISATSKHLVNSQILLEDEAKAWDQGVLEDLKRQRDSLVSMRELFERKDRYDKDNIPSLERRIQSNEQKLVAIRAKPEGSIKPGEVEKVTEAIIKDKQSIVAQHARGVFIKECVRDELIYFQSSQYHVSRWNQDWAQERVKYSELQADNWKQLQEQLESMPLGE